MTKKELVLVTGGIGYIGSHTTVELIHAGYEVVIIDNLSNSRIEVLDGIEKITGIRPSFEQFDLCDKNKLKDFFSAYPGINSIIHFAAFKSVSESVKHPTRYYRNNLHSLLNLLEEMTTHQVQNIVFSSSCTVYGQPDKLPVTENCPLKRPFSPYGKTKQMSEEIIHDTVNTTSGLQAISLRYFNPIGAHPSAEIGELPLGVPDNLVPYITQTGIGVRNYLRVYGDDYNTPDGSCIRDYIHVVDLAKAHEVAITRLLNRKNKTNYEVFNLGTGKGVSVFEMIASFERVSGTKLKHKVAERRPGDIEQVWADTRLANDILKWKAGYTVDEAMLSAWNWEKKFRQKI
jgi:UDP-glucose 4-epimerase